MVCKMGLKSLLVSQVFINDFFLAAVAVFPVCLRRFIPAQMDVARGEDFDDFQKQFFKQSICFFIPRAENVLGYSPGGADFDFFVHAFAEQFRIGSENRVRVPGEIDFRDDFQMELFCMRNYFCRSSFV